jgi:hypothetical protein
MAMLWHSCILVLRVSPLHPSYAKLSFAPCEPSPQWWMTAVHSLVSVTSG